MGLTRKEQILAGKDLTPLTREELMLAGKTVTPLTQPERFKVKAYSGGGGVTPTGTISITENGTYDVTEYAMADVDAGITPTGTLSIVQNGTYDVTAYASAEVDIPVEEKTYLPLFSGSVTTVVKWGKASSDITFENLHSAQADIRVTFNNVEYELTGSDEGGGTYLYGAPTVDNAIDFSVYPFQLWLYGMGEGQVATEQAGTYTMSIDYAATRFPCGVVEVPMQSVTTAIQAGFLPVPAAYLGDGSDYSFAAGAEVSVLAETTLKNRGSYYLAERESAVLSAAGFDATYYGPSFDGSTINFKSYDPIMLVHAPDTNNGTQLRGWFVATEEAGTFNLGVVRIGVIPHNS